MTVPAARINLTQVTQVSKMRRVHGTVSNANIPILWTLYYFLDYLLNVFLGKFLLILHLRDQQKITQENNYATHK